MSAASLGTAAVLDHAVQNFSAEHLVAAGTEDLDEAVIRLIEQAGVCRARSDPPNVCSCSSATTQDGRADTAGRCVLETLLRLIYAHHRAAFDQAGAPLLAFFPLTTPAISVRPSMALTDAARRCWSME